MNHRSVAVKIPLILWVVTILVFSSLPGTRLPSSALHHGDKIAHFLEYMVLAFLASRYFYHVRRHTITAAAHWAVMAAVVFASMDELHQLLIPHRSCAWLDLVADAAGSLLGAMMFFRYQYNRRAR